MIAFAQRPQQKSKKDTAWHDGFLKILPAIRRNAQIAFRHLLPESRDDAVHEVVASATVAYARLFELGNIDVAYASVLARFGIAQYRVGRRVGNKMNARDILSPYAQRRKNILVESLDRYCDKDGQWLEAVVEDKRCGPAEIAACRIDFADWLAHLSPRQRRIAKVLAIGETTARTAKRFRISAGRISQIRSELRQSWQAFQGEVSSNGPDAAVA